MADAFGNGRFVGALLVRGVITLFACVIWLVCVVFLELSDVGTNELMGFVFLNRVVLGGGRLWVDGMMVSLVCLWVSCLVVSRPLLMWRVVNSVIMRIMFVLTMRVGRCSV